ncbi:hypothetical protein CBP51_10500 [Cellvibrio mixtus]|uniref:Uncharacterized protein n=1 Tax=Cellvibrio mixtus TaxID=39650 RepID=A0A266QBX2_9GAMM|nr:hypothetical protein CBP51_10500 [Cellvibrio mixtus]
MHATYFYFAGGFGWARGECEGLFSFRRDWFSGKYAGFIKRFGFVGDFCGVSHKRIPQSAVGFAGTG